MTSPYASPIADIPADDADLDLILKTGIHGGFWPFATLPGSLPRSVLHRVAERFRVMEAADAAFAEAIQRNREGVRRELLAALDKGLDDAATA